MTPEYVTKVRETENKAVESYLWIWKTLLASGSLTDNKAVESSPGFGRPCKAVAHRVLFVI